MKALLSYAPGGPESLSLTEIDPPVPGSGEVLLRVAACGVNFPDLLLIQDRYQIRPPRPFAPGSEVAGLIAAVGPDAAGCAVGDRVMAICSWGGMSEQLILPTRLCVPVPEGLPLEVAAAFQLTYGTAHYALTDVGLLRVGQTVLVLGAAGGVGLATVEIAKALGARVVAAVSSAEKAAVAGADDTVIYPRELGAGGVRDLARQLRAACGQGADLVIDPVGGAYAEAALRSIGHGGRHVVVGFAAGIGSVPLNLVLFSHATLVGAPYGAVVAQDPVSFRKTTRALLELHAAGSVHPRIGARFPLEEGAKALALLESRGALGKIIVEIADWDRPGMER
jgi:NADPH2:quinone reductase